MPAGGEKKTKDGKTGEKKPRKPKEKRYTRRLEIHLSDEQYGHLETLNGGFGFHVRSMINAHMGQYNKEEDELKNRLSVVEPEYFAIKKRLAEIDDMKRRDALAVMEKDKSIEFAHMKLLESLKSNYNRIDLMPENVWKFYSDQCGEPVDELKTWVREEMAKKGIKV